MGLPAQPTPGSVWLQVEATQPYVEGIAPELHATLPLQLLDPVYEATPASFIEKGKEMGFDFPAIRKTIHELGMAQPYEHLSEGTQPEISKQSQLRQGKSSYVVLKLGTGLGMRFQLRTMSRIVSFITSRLSAFRGKEEAIETVITLANQLPPGVYLEASDGVNSYSIELR